MVELQISYFIPRWDKITKITIVGLLLLIPARTVPLITQELYIGLFSLLMLIGFFLPIVLSLLSLSLYRRPATYFLVAFSAYLVVIILTLVNINTNYDAVNYIAVLRATFLWTIFVLAIGTNKNVEILRTQQERAQEKLVIKQKEALSIQMQLAKDLLFAKDQLTTSYDMTLEGWVMALQLREKETVNHSRNITKLTVSLAKKVGIDQEGLQHIRRGALLHDIGKMAIPDNILFKPAALNKEEWKIMKTHPLLAKSMLENIEFLKNSLDIPLYHHENWDGTGYPYGIEADKIPLAARLFSIVDNWDALTSDRPYRKAWTKTKTIKYIRENSEIKFDPAIVEEFLKLVN